MIRALIFLLLFFTTWAHGLDIKHHKLAVKIKPENNYIHVVDTLTCDNNNVKELRFTLHGNLQVKVNSPDWKLQLEGKTSWQVSGINAHYQQLDAFFPIHNYSLIPLKNIEEKVIAVEISYEGKISLPPKASAEEYVRSFSETPGIISTEGVYLTSSSLWYPQQQNKMVSFSLEIEQPEGWKLISQGKRLAKKDKNCIIWDCTIPMEEIYLVGGSLLKFSRTYENIEMLVYLHERDEALADKYLTATAQYLKMYNELLGQYPYSKFALVENFWETGYGMPSFTLLGPRIIRFPFILRSSYPHEILHNWWGNGVFVDYSKGNWCEGLTAYLADHLFKEQEGTGPEARRSSLQRYRNFVRSQDDFALSAFQSRHSPATEAVGYGKCMMLFHELRKKIGNDLFIKGLKKFYQDFQFKKASFDDIAQTYTTVTGQDLSKFFADRVSRVGAPDIKIKNVTSINKNGFQLHFTLSQLQPKTIYELQIPVAITLKGEEKVSYHQVLLSEKEQSFSLTFDKQPMRIDIDPEFDLFRKVDRSEIPSSFGQLFGSETALLVSKNPQNYTSVLEKWGNQGNIKLVNDREISQLPKDKTVWFLGTENNFSPYLKELFIKKHNAEITKNTLIINDEKVDLSNHIAVLCTQHPDDENLAIGWILGDALDAVSAVARKLPHYGKYSYLAFKGAEANNILKGQWSVLDSQMTYHITETKFSMGQLPQSPPLAKLPEIIDSKELEKHVAFLASENMRGRGLGTVELDNAAQYISNFMKEVRLQPIFGNSYLQTFTSAVDHPQKQMKITNVVGFIPGTDPKFSNEPIVIGAHYDHLGTGWPDVRYGNEGKIHPGADDNASGIAILLEVAKTFAKKPQSLRPVIFVAFSGEEAGRLGSQHFVSSLGNLKPLTMINLDSVGRLEGRELLAFGTGSTREWPFICFGCAAVTNVKIKAIPESEDSSDHTSFWEKGIPAIQLFSGAHIDYHKPTDTIDKLDFPGMIKVMAVLQEMITYLASRDKPLTIIGQKSETTTNTDAKTTSRRASLGTIPDFANSGNGVRISGTVPNSPAHKVGMKEGDVIVELGGTAINNLREFSDVLKQHQPGDKVWVKYKRDDMLYQIEVILSER